MITDSATGIALVFGLGMAAQWLAWRLRLPAILLLLATGLAVGPVSGLMDPDALFGDGLLTLVGIAVGIVLFEGGLGLHLKEIREVGGTLTRLVTLGAGITWLLAAAFARLLLGLDWSLALLLGATLVVTGPTVIGPLLRHVRPTGRAASVLKWEGLVIDPVGATLALLVFEGIVRAADAESALLHGLLGIAWTIVVGCALGIAGAALVWIAIRRYWLPDFLQNPVVLGIVVLIFVGANALQHEAGFLATTLMGALLANQKRVSLHHVVEFKENLRVLIIASLFIVLAARVSLEDLGLLGWPFFAFLAALVFIVRPASVVASSFGSRLTWPERAFVSWMAPRGIVAAAVASVFAGRLEKLGFEQAPVLVAATFAVILGTVSLYGLTAAPIARKLGVAGPAPQGLLIVGAQAWARSLAAKIRQLGFPVVMIDTNRENVRAARLDGLSCHWGNALFEGALESVDLGGIGRALAVTPNHEVNRLLAHQLSETFGRAACHRLAGPEDKRHDKTAQTHDAAGRILGSSDLDHAYVVARWNSGARFRITKITEEWTWKDLVEASNGTARLLFLLRAGKLMPQTADHTLEPRAGDEVLVLADPDEDREA